MRTRALLLGFFLSVGVVCFAVFAQPATPGANATTPATSETAANTSVNLPPAAEDVLKLTRAQVGDEVTINYIKNSDATFNLSDKDVNYLKSEGVSDPVITAMIDQGRNQPTAAPEDNAAPSQPTGSLEAPVAAPDTMPQAAPLYAPAPEYTYSETPPPAETMPVETMPAQETPPSTIYVMPSSSPSVYYQAAPIYVPRAYTPASTVVIINSGYGGHRYYSSAFHGGSHGSFHSFGHH